MADIVAARDRFAARIEAKLPGSSAWLALDLGPGGAWHLHGVLIIPARWHISDRRLARWWAACTPKSRRNGSGDMVHAAAVCSAGPVGKQPQRIVSFPADLAQLEYKLTHDLKGPHRAGFSAGVGTMWTHVACSGLLARPWDQLGPWIRGEVHPCPRVRVAPLPRPRKAPTLPAQPVIAAGPAWCCWCAKSLVVGRRHARTHPQCRDQRSRALVTLARTHGHDARALAERLEREGTATPDAIRGVLAIEQWALREAERAVRGTPFGSWAPVPVLAPLVFLRRMIPRCPGCGGFLGRRLDALTCGSRHCRHDRCKQTIASTIALDAAGRTAWRELRRWQRQMRHARGAA